MTSPWMTGGQGGPSFRLLDDGYVEIEGQGTPTRKLPQAVKQWAPEIYAAQAATGIPAHIIAGVVGLESGGNPNIISADGGWGLMQITDPSLKKGYSKAEVLDPATNVMIGARVLRSAWDRYGGNLVKVLVSFNAGGAYPGGGCQARDPDTKKCVSRCTPNQWNLVGACSNGKTLDYPGIIIGYANDALTNGFPVGNGPGAKTESAPSPSRVSSAPTLFALLGSSVFLGGAYLFAKRRSETGRWPI
jgi:hypothetical protein